MILTILKNREMKHLLLWSAAALLLASCSGKCKDSSSCDNCTTDSTAHATGAADDQMTIYEYEGTMDDNGVDTDYLLVITALSPVGDGTYELTTSYVNPESGEMLTFTDEGEKLTVLGIPGDSTVVIYQLVSAQDGSKRNFRAEGDSVLKRVGADFKESVDKVKQKLTRKTS
jgi:hypothetical protein